MSNILGTHDLIKTDKRQCGVNSLFGSVKYGAAVHMLAVTLRHGPGTRLGAEKALVTLVLQLR